MMDPTAGSIALYPGTRTLIVAVSNYLLTMGGEECINVKCGLGVRNAEQCKVFTFFLVGFHFLIFFFFPLARCDGQVH